MAGDKDGEEAAFQAEIAHRLAFDARFPPEAFEPVARALHVCPTEQNLKGVREWLMPYFEMFFSGSIGRKSSLAARIATIRQFRDAAAVMKTSLSPRAPGGLRWAPTLGLLDAVDDQFIATVERLWQAADEQVRRLEAISPSRGRPPKTAFREFAPDLVWIYEKITGKEARKPYWVRESSAYGGPFFGFAVAVWQCLRSHVSQARPRLPNTEVALAQELQLHWPKAVETTG